MKFKVQNPHSKFYPAGRSYVSTQEGGSYRGQIGKPRPSRAGSEEEEEEEDGSEEEGKQQLGTVGVPLACSLLPGSPGSWSQTSDVPCSCLPGCWAERAWGTGK